MILLYFGPNDTLSGGAGNDTFYYGGWNGVTIKDLGPGDVINLQVIDANWATEEDDPFNFIADAAFSHKVGELRFQHVAGQDYGFIEGDLSGEGYVSFSLRIENIDPYDPVPDGLDLIL